MASWEKRKDGLWLDPSWEGKQERDGERGGGSRPSRLAAENDRRSDNETKASTKECLSNHSIINHLAQYEWGDMSKRANKSLLTILLLSSYNTSIPLPPLPIYTHTSTYRSHPRDGHRSLHPQTSKFLQAKEHSRYYEHWDSLDKLSFQEQSDYLPTLVPVGR